MGAVAVQDKLQAEGNFFDDWERALAAHLDVSAAWVMDFTSGFDGGHFPRDSQALKLGQELRERYEIEDSEIEDSEENEGTDNEEGND